MAFVRFVVINGPRSLVTVLYSIIPSLAAARMPILSFKPYLLTEVHIMLNNCHNLWCSCRCHPKRNGFKALMGNNPYFNVSLPYAFYINNELVYLWTCVGVGVNVCRHECVQVWMCVLVNMWSHERLCLWTCVSVNVWICARVERWTCGSVNLWRCEHLNMCMCEYVYL